MKPYRLVYAAPHARRWRGRAYRHREARDATVAAFRAAGATVRTWDIRRLP